MKDINDVGLEGVKKLMEIDFRPRMHTMKRQARTQYENVRRKFGERPKWYFRRLDQARARLKRVDPDFVVTPDMEADIIFYNSGLDRTEPFQ